MFDHLFGLLLLGLGIQSPVTQPAVKGVQNQLAKNTDSNSGKDGSEFSFRESTETTLLNSSGATGVEDSVKGKKVREMREEKKYPIGASAKHTVTDARKEMREALKLELKEGKDAYRARFADHKEEFESEVEAKHAEASEKFLAKKEEMEQKLNEFKDQKKKRLVENIQTKIAELNSKLVLNITERLGKISGVLDETVAKKATLGMTGEETTIFDEAVTAAQTAILLAQDALAVQATKVYVITISTETNAKNDVGITLKALNSDRKALNDAVVSARKSVSLAIQELAKLRKEEVPEAVIQ